MSTFHKRHRPHLLIGLLLVLLAGASGYVAFVWSPPEPENTTLSEPSTLTQETTPTSTPAPNTSTPSPQPKIIKEKNPPPSVPTPPSSTEPIPVPVPLPETVAITIPATLFVQAHTYTHDVPVNSSVYDFMKILREKTDLRFSGTDYGGQLGFFVSEINGTKNNDQKNFVWIYYINNKKATIGASTYILKPHDIITWKYEQDETR